MVTMVRFWEFDSFLNFLHVHVLRFPRVPRRRTGFGRISVPYGRCFLVTPQIPLKWMMDDDYIHHGVTILSRPRGSKKLPFGCSWKRKGFPICSYSLDISNLGEMF